VAPILQFIRADAAAFDDATTSVMDGAFDATCAEFQDVPLSNLAREIIADRIIEAAKRGERDPKRLFDIGVAALKRDLKTG
jgi:hypothetical protein